MTKTVPAHYFIFAEEQWSAFAQGHSAVIHAGCDGIPSYARLWTPILDYLWTWNGFCTMSLFCWRNLVAFWLHFDKSKRTFPIIQGETRSKMCDETLDPTMEEIEDNIKIKGRPCPFRSPDSLKMGNCPLMQEYPLLPFSNSHARRLIQLQKTPCTQSKWGFPRVS
jgi:hypothetical protein